MRKPLLLAPSYECVEPDRDAYLNPFRLRPLAKEAGRYWSFHSMPTTVGLSGNRYVKSLKGFTSHTDEASFRELLREYAELGVPRPSGYADVFHARFRSPFVNYSVNKRLAPALAGGWQAAITPGVHIGTYHRYDMRSAYLWAASLGMPDPATYVRSLNFAKTLKGFPMRPRKGICGLYRVKMLRNNPAHPFPFNYARECLASAEEIEVYDLEIAEYVEGVTWTRTLDPEPILSAVHAVTNWKLAARSFWGMWGQSTRVECHANGKSWTLPNPALNAPWAHAIVSRVKMRLWQFAGTAVHVFVDSVITRDALRCGDSIGDWRLERTYPDGVVIRAPGQYGDLNELRLEKHAGVQRSTRDAQRRAV